LVNADANVTIHGLDTVMAFNLTRLDPSSNGTSLAMEIHLPVGDDLDEAGTPAGQQHD
jgi:hypothetical protein